MKTKPQVSTLFGDGTMVAVRQGEWWTDYRCWRCGEEITVAADSDAERSANKGHTCAGHPVRNHLARG